MSFISLTFPIKQLYRTLGQPQFQQTPLLLIKNFKNREFLKRSTALTAAAKGKKQTTEKPNQTNPKPLNHRGLVLKWHKRKPLDNSPLFWKNLIRTMKIN